MSHAVYFICDENDNILDEFHNKAKAHAYLKKQVRDFHEYNIPCLGVYLTAYIMQIYE